MPPVGPAILRCIVRLSILPLSWVPVSCSPGAAMMTTIRLPLRPLRLPPLLRLLPPLPNRSPSLSLPLLRRSPSPNPSRS